MVWGLPPERAGRAPQASRHSNSADVVVARLVPVVDGAAGFGAEGVVGPISGAETESILVVLEQALTMDATPTLPASPSS
ncbi:MAG: hypothetical protein QOD10_353 [Mycobacterium sp.]|jgi:hypothetical protein|nr:hypothetical protein [Mycobacterium sp.]